MDGLAPRADGVEDVGAPFATAVFGRLFQLPRADWATFAALARAASVNLDPLAGPAVAMAGRAAMGELSRFLTAHARTVTEGPLARLGADTRLTERERTGILGLAVVGGWQPLAEAVGNALYWLLPRPDAVALLREGDADDARLLVQELLRLEAPIPFTARVARAQAALPGGTVPRGGRGSDHHRRGQPRPGRLRAPRRAGARPGRQPPARVRRRNPLLSGGPTGARMPGVAAHPAGAPPPPLSLAQPSGELDWDPRPLPRRLLGCPVTTGSADVH